MRRARLQGHIDSGVAEIAIRRLNGSNLGVRSTRSYMPPLSHCLVANHEYGADERIRGGAAEPSACQGDGAAHPMGVVLAHFFLPLIACHWL